jgi:hypothetical protein
MSPDTTVYALWYIREASVAIWVGNLICCWQLLQKVFKLRSFDDTSAGYTVRERMINATERSIGGHSKNSAWYSRRIAQMRPLRVEGEDEDAEKALRDGVSSSGATASDGDTITRNRPETMYVLLSACKDQANTPQDQLHFRQRQ